MRVYRGMGRDKGEWVRDICVKCVSFISGLHHLSRIGTGVRW